MSMGQNGRHMNGNSTLCLELSVPSLPRHSKIASRNMERSSRRPCCPLHKWRGQPHSLPVIIEDLEDGEKVEHPPSGPVPPMDSMPQAYKDAVLESSKRKKSKGVKRVLSLHYAIQQKKQKGTWIRPDAPMQGLTNAQQTWMNDRVAKAIATAPWHKK